MISKIYLGKYFELNTLFKKIIFYLIITTQFAQQFDYF